MGGKLVRRKRRKLNVFRNEKGYLLLTTLFFLVLSGLFSHYLIRISANQILQYRQFSTSYQAKGTLNMSEKLIRDYIKSSGKTPARGFIHTSLGEIKVDRLSDQKYLLTIVLENGLEFSKESKIEMPQIEENELLDNQVDQQEENNNEAQKTHE